MAGDDTHPARFAFIEFETSLGAQAAMGLTGTILIDRPIKYGVHYRHRGLSQMF